MRVQYGVEPRDFKAMTAVGPGASEIRVKDETGAWRAIYVAKFEAAIFVLHAFRKKSRRTSRADLELARTRYKIIGARS